MPPPRRAGSAVARIRASTRSVTGTASGWTPPLPSAAARHAAARRFEHVGVAELHAVEAVGVQVDHNGVAVLHQRDRPPEDGLGRDVADDQTDRSTREACVGHQRDGDVALSAQRGDPRGRVEQFGHPGCAPRPLVADHHHVVVLEAVRMPVERLDEGALAVEHAGAAGEDAVLHAPFDAGHLEDGAAIGSEVAAQQAQSAGVLEGLRRPGRSRPRPEAAGPVVVAVRPASRRCRSWHRRRGTRRRGAPGR